MEINTAEIKREFVFGTYVQSTENSQNDAIFVKEILHHPDGRTKRQLRKIENYQRPFYITKPEFQDHKDKKEWESLYKLNKYTSNQANLAGSIFKVLNGHVSNRFVKLTDVAESPFVYGADITTPVLLHKEYKERYPDLMSPATLAVMDYEWDVVKGTGDILAGVISFKEKLHLAITTEFLGNQASSATDDIIKGLNKHLGSFIKERNIVPKITIVDTPAKVVLALMKSAHEWQPDFLGFWNIKGDITKILAALKKERIDPAWVFSDPSVPREYKSFKWKEDQLVKKKSTGETHRKHIADLWHTVTAPSSFYCVCLMALHKHIRSRDQNRSSYALDSVLHDYVNLRKLKFKEIPEHLIGVDWHKEMQKYHKIEYMVYLAFDGISCEVLDEETKDVCNSLRSNADISELNRIKSNPKRLGDDKHFTLLATNRVICSTSSNMSEYFDTLTPSVKNWILTLSSDLVHDIGLPLINEYPDLATNITTHSFDLDVKSAYPTGEICLNVSKTTRLYEVCSIIGLTTDQQRAIGINFTNVKVNCLSLAKAIYDFPDVDYLLEEFKKQ